MPRARRSTAKAINYSKNQEFSDDDDVFEDGPGASQNDINEPKELPTSTRKGRPRKSNVYVQSSSNYESFSSEYDVPEKYRHFEKGYDMSQPHIRERFDFMPELELDGSPKVDLIVGRRVIGDGDQDDPYDESQDNSIDEDEDDSESNSPPKRRKSRTSKQNKDTEKKKDKDSPTKHHAEYEYLVKYKGKSYLHLEWKAASELESMNKSAKNLYRRFLKKIQTGTDDSLEDPEVDAAYIQPQRIVDEEEHELTVELTDEELVEWERKQALENDEESSQEGQVINKEKEKATEESFDKKEIKNNDVSTTVSSQGKKTLNTFRSTVLRAFVTKVDI
jgi:hypothetical protein